MFARCLYYRFTSFIQSSINAVICPRVSLLNQCLQLDQKRKIKKEDSYLHLREEQCHLFIQSVTQSGISQCTLNKVQVSMAQLKSSCQILSNRFLYLDQKFFCLSHCRDYLPTSLNHPWAFAKPKIFKI